MNWCRFYRAFSRAISSAGQLTRDVNAALAAMKAEDSYGQLLAAHGLKP